MTTPRDIALLRIAAQRIAGDGCSATEVVRWLTAAQAQDFPGTLAAIALRTGEGTRAGVIAALDAGEVVRSWPMRGTLHLVTAEDLRWMLDLTAERTVATTLRRREQLGITPADLDEAARIAREALGGGRALVRDELLARWERGGLRPTQGRGYHLIFQLTQRQLLCYGPVRGSEPAFVLLDEWIPEPRRLERDEALGEWALRYFRGHGPATTKDFGWWTKLRAADVKAGVALARPHLERVEVDGIEYLMDPETPELLERCRKQARGLFLLPGFDEFVLGYGDRSAAVPPEFARRIVPGNNGMFLPTVVSGGRVIGTWKHAGSGRNRRAQPTPFTTFSATTEAAITACYRAYP